MEEKKELIFRYRIGWHILFWVFWYLFYYAAFGNNEPGFISEFKMNLYFSPARVIGTYAFIYWILPKFLFQKKYFLFALFTILHGILFGLAVWMTYRFIPVTNVPELSISIESILYDRAFNFPLIRPIILNYQIPATAAAIVIFKRWYLINKYSSKLEKENLEAELSFLKSQIHPHFLFNTLNNLYALTLKKSDKAPEVVIQLSNMLEYMLYSGKEKYVPLSSEIKQLNEYINLEKIRYGDRLIINVEFAGDIDNKMISPLILHPFVENCFKHGASTSIKSPYIEIMLNVVGNNLNFIVKNTYQEEDHVDEGFRKGIGLTNVRRRLELLYPNNNTLDICSKDGIYKVELNLDLVFNKEQNSLKNEK